METASHSFLYLIWWIAINLILMLLNRVKFSLKVCLFASICITVNLGQKSLISRSKGLLSCSYYYVGLFLPFCPTPMCSPHGDCHDRKVSNSPSPDIPSLLCLWKIFPSYWSGSYFNCLLLSPHRFFFLCYSAPSQLLILQHVLKTRMMLRDVKIS